MYKHFIRHCRHHFLRLSFWKSLKELRATERTAFQNVLPVRFFVSVIWVIFWKQEDVTETSIAFLRKKNSKNAVFVGSGFLALGGGSLDKTFFNAKSIHLYTRKRSKKITYFDGGSLDHCFCSNMFDFGLHFFQFIFASFFLVRPRWGSGKSTRKSSPFFEFSRIIAYKISIDLVLLWCKLFMVLLPRSWIVLVFLPRSPKIFLDFFPRSWKILQNLANFAKNNCQDLGKKCQKSKKFLGKKTKTPSTG